MIIAHNLSAMNANRMFNINNKKRASMTEKLSSGYKINRSADDAAGLAISEKMRRQIRGLDQGAQNIQEGISLVQVADGALNETHDILQRMNELAVKAANGTNTGEDREYIQSEIDQLIEEVNRIANTTSFNEGIYPLKSKTISSENTFDDSKLRIDSSGISWYLPSEFTEITIPFRVGSGSVQIDGITYTQGQKGYLYAVAYPDSNNSSYYYSWTGNIFAGIGVGSCEVQHDGWIENSLTMADLQVDTNGYVYFNDAWANNKKRYLVDGFNTEPDAIYDITWAQSGTIPAGESLPAGWKYITATPYSKDTSNLGNSNIGSVSGNNGKDLWIQMGTEPGQGMFIDLVDATADTLGVANVDVTTQDNAGAAISAIKNAINTVSKYRSNFGAQQNRLEHGYNANLNTVENTTASESQIRDTDMAMQMVDFSNSNIIAQAGQAMLAQANQMNQNILALLG